MFMPWIMIAEAKIGRGDHAHDYYLRTNPSVRQDLSNCISASHTSTPNDRGYADARG
jgi:cellobiose phosphorylase